MSEDLNDLMRVALDKRAEEAGVPDPGSLPNKQAVIDAITALESNPALVPEPEVRTEERYKVVGPHAVRGHEPGTTFTALLSPEQETSLTEAGHIRKEN